MSKKPLSDGDPLPMLSLPIPPPLLHPNARSGWQAKHRQRSGYRRTCGDLAALHAREHFGAPGPRLDDATVLLHFRFGPPKKGGRRKTHDPDNLIAWSKATIDSLTDGGLLADDRALVYLPPLQTIDGVGVIPEGVLEVRLWKGHAWHPTNG